MNRLAQFQVASGVSLTGAVPAPGMDAFSPVKVTITESPGEQDAEAASTLDRFYQLVTSVEASVSRLEQLIQDMASKHSEIMSTVDEMKCNALRRDVDDLANQVNEAAQSSGQTIEAMKKETDALKQTPEMESHFVGVIRIEENQRRYMLQKLSHVMEMYQRQQQTVEQRYRTQTERQIKIKYTNPDGSAIDDATAKELAVAVLENNTTSGIFQQSKDVLAQIIETRNDIYRIEQSMRTLNQLFNDLAFLVHEQGEIMDVILRNIQQTTRYVEAGRKELKKARKYQKSSRKKLCCIVICVAVVVVLFVVAGVLGKTL